MLFRVIEHFRDKHLLRERFQRQGRMLPETVVYQASWLAPANDRCYQAMETPHRQALTPWIEPWSDIVHFEIIPVLTSQELWETGESKDLRVAVD